MLQYKNRFQFEEKKQKKMSADNFNYVYLALPQGAQINILTPILNAEDRNNNGMIDPDEHDSASPMNQFDLMIGVKAKSEEGNTEEETTNVYSETQIKRHERLQRDIMRKKMARLKETEQQRIERLQKDRERKKLSRQNETFEQRQRRLEKDRIRTQKRRALESEEKRRRRLEKNRISKRNARIKENSSFLQ